MAKIEVKNLKGKKVEEIELNPKIFGLEVNDELVSGVLLHNMQIEEQPLLTPKQ